MDFLAYVREGSEYILSKTDSNYLTNNLYMDYGLYTYSFLHFFVNQLFFLIPYYLINLAFFISFRILSLLFKKFKSISSILFETLFFSLFVRFQLQTLLNCYIVLFNNVQFPKDSQEYKWVWNYVSIALGGLFVLGTLAILITIIITIIRN